MLRKELKRKIAIFIASIIVLVSWVIIIVHLVFYKAG
jgi:hypothetical protein